MRVRRRPAVASHLLTAEVVSPTLDRAMLEGLPTAVLIVSDEGRVEFANGRARQVLKQDPTSRDVAEVLVTLEKLRATCDGNRAEHQLRDVTLGYQATRTRSVDGAKFTVVFQDITEVARLRDERDRLLQLATVGDVLPAILHELKNPLAAIRTAVELLVEEAHEGPQRDDLHAVLTEIRRLGLTLDGVGRVNQELYAPRHAAIDLAVREAVYVLKSQAGPRGVALTHDIATLPLLPMDPGCMRGVVFNLVVNAIHASVEGATIHVRLGLVSDQLVLSVKDTGAGMTPEVHARCRELFFTTKPKGSGIGLALVNTIATQSGGSLSIVSSPGKGTEVVMRVPANHPQSSRKTP